MAISLEWLWPAQHQTLNPKSCHLWQLNSSAKIRQSPKAFSKDICKISLVLQITADVFTLVSVQALPSAFSSKDLNLLLRHNSVHSSVHGSLMVLQAERSLELLIVYSHDMTENSVPVNRNKTLRHSAELEMQRKPLREKGDCSPKSSCPYFVWIYVLKLSKPVHRKGKERKEKYSRGRGNSTDGINTGKWHCSKTVIYVTILIDGFFWVHWLSHPWLQLCFVTMTAEPSMTFLSSPTAHSWSS